MGSMMGDELLSDDWLQQARYKLTQKTGVPFMRVERDDHHLAHYGNEWLARKEAKYIRNQTLYATTPKYTFNIFFAVPC